VGSYTDGLFKRNRLRSVDNPKGYRKKEVCTPNESSPLERLVACAIVRGGNTYSYGFKSHADIRRELGDKNPYTSTVGDREGFLTSTDRFVGRYEANKIGAKAGQCVRMERQFLSSDVDMW